MTITKRPGGRDHRDDDVDDSDDATKFRVDRVYGRPRARESASDVAAEVLRQSQAPAPDGGEGEGSLRRQLSRLQRQLAEAQHELANKEDELAAEVHARIAMGVMRDSVVAERRQLEARLDQLASEQARSTGMEQRLADSLAKVEELAHALEHERAEHDAVRSRLDELTGALDAVRTHHNNDRTLLEQRHAAEIAEIESQKRTALDAAEATMAAMAARLRDAHESELAELRGAHERSVSTLRGELEPKLLEARTIAEERERLAGELAALRSEAARTVAELEEARRLELAKLQQAHAAELAAHERTHATELNRALGERNAEIFAHQQTVRSSELREQLWDQTLTQNRDAQKKLQLELAEAKERCALLESDKTSAEERLASATLLARSLADEQRELRAELEANEAEVRRNAKDRLRFVAYLEEGLALLGALPPADPATGERASDPDLDGKR